MGFLLAATGLGLASPVAGSASITVNSNADANDAGLNGICETAYGNGTCTLRAAVSEANYYANTAIQPVTIHLPAGVYVLTLGALGISQNDVSLSGAGAAVTIIDGNGIGRVLVTSGASNVIALSGVTITGGRPALGANGGGIYNDGAALSVTGCVVHDNQVLYANGGGISSEGGSLDVVDSVVRVNHAPVAYGGGIQSHLGHTTVVRSSVSENTAGAGGGLEQEGGTLRIVNSTISSNAATVSGGGLYFLQVSGATLNSATVVGNVADSDFDGLGEGGGISFASSSVTLANSVLNNYNYYGPNDDDLDDCAAHSSTVTSNGYNIVEAPGACAVLGAYSQASFAYGPLLDNGGFTKTHALPAGSVAIDSGSLGGCTDAFGAPLTTDQRGVKRIVGARCDLGAFEAEPIGDANGDGAVDVADVFYLINYLFAAGAVPHGRANVNGDAAVNVGDVFSLVDYLFAGGIAPA